LVPNKSTGFGNHALVSNDEQPHRAASVANAAGSITKRLSRANTLKYYLAAGSCTTRQIARVCVAIVARSHLSGAWALRDEIE
jgi:hypothetical protein